MSYNVVKKKQAVDQNFPSQQQIQVHGWYLNKRINRVRLEHDNESWNEIPACINTTLSLWNQFISW